MKCCKHSHTYISVPLPKRGIAGLYIAWTCRVENAKPYSKAFIPHDAPIKSSVVWRAPVGNLEWEVLSMSTRRWGARSSSTALWVSPPYPALSFLVPVSSTQWTYWSLSDHSPCHRPDLGSRHKAQVVAELTSLASLLSGHSPEPAVVQCLKSIFFFLPVL